MSEIKQVLEQRGNRYGSFEDNAATVQALKDICKKSPSWQTMEPFHKEAIEMVLHKLARILNGDCNYIDSYKDIIGFTQLVINILNNKEGATDAAVTPMVRKSGKWIEKK